MQRLLKKKKMYLLIKFSKNKQDSVLYSAELHTHFPNISTMFKATIKGATGTDWEINIHLGCIYPFYVYHIRDNVFF